MKLGLSMWSYVALWQTGQMDIPAFVREAARLQVDGVELLDFFWRDRERELPLVVDALRETGLTVCAYSVSNNFAVQSASERAAQVKVIADGVDSALQFGANVVRVFAGNLETNMDLDDALLECVEGLADAAAYAAPRNVTLALENHGRLAGRSDQIAYLLDAVNSPALRANVDTGNFLLVHEAPHDAAELLAPRAAYAHLKDLRLATDDDPAGVFHSTDGAHYAGTVLGEGDVDLADCVQSLTSAGVQWAAIEYEGLEDPTTAVPRCVAHARQILGVT